MIRLLAYWLICCGVGHADLEDPGRRVMGKVAVKVYYATDGDPARAGSSARPVSQEQEKRFRAEEKLRFSHYRLLGTDLQPLLQSYESWAQPLKPSHEILVRFEAQGHPTPAGTVLDLELWLGRKKTLKSVAKLEGGRPLFVLGPKWREGRLLISVALAGGEDKLLR